MPKLVWERVDDEWKDGPPPDGATYRAKVPGGWLVSVWAGGEQNQKWGGGLTFLPGVTWNVDLWSSKAPKKKKKKPVATAKARVIG